MAKFFFADFKPIIPRVIPAKQIKITKGDTKVRQIKIIANCGPGIPVVLAPIKNAPIEIIILITPNTKEATAFPFGSALDGC